ncbi:MAG: phosphatidylserine decarboxylase family protein [Candidatus Marinimicrobia bacterium]|nr:phosphatidylserine decarboxylase family protein [Candidatus Neomarinimicrobiota bacterium]
MAKEGLIIILPLLLLAVVAGIMLWWQPQTWTRVVAWCCWLLLIFCLQFFRDPKRSPPDDEHAFVSPADGRIVTIKNLDYDEHVGGAALQVSIFLSVFNIHVQRVPFDATVVDTSYRRGSFLAAFNQRASEENEQAIAHFASNSGNFKIKQIAGVIARRIISYMHPGGSVLRGERLGYIRFGSRVDIILPADFQLAVKLGDKVNGTTSIIGYFK